MKMRKTIGALAAIAVVLFAASVTAVPVHAWNTGGTGNQFSGRAIGVLVAATTPLGTSTVTFADTGPLPPSGGFISATPVDVQTSAVDAKVLLSVTMGFDGQAESQAAVADVTLLPGSPNQITAEVLFSQSKATCTGVSGFSNIASLTFQGQKITVSGSPGQTISVPGVLTLVINEQIIGPGNSITVNALDLTTYGPVSLNVIVSSAHSDIFCPPPPPPNACTKDFVTAGGWIPTSGGNGKDTFGFHAGYKHDCRLSGHVEYIDHSNGVRVSTSSVTSYGGTGNTRTFSGLAAVNGQTVTYTITAMDDGEPGAGNDQFTIRLCPSTLTSCTPSTQTYSASGTLGGGNIEIHS
jgi:hypothetical protein